MSNDSYTTYKASYPLKLLFRALITTDPIKRQSLLNKQRDYMGLHEKPDLMLFHAVIEELLTKADKFWDSYDYGQSYFYQSCQELGITGLRNTEARVQTLGLDKLVAGKTVFEVGVNVGFVTLALARSAKHIEGIEINPYLVDIANKSSEYLEVENIKIVAESFEDHVTNKAYEVFLSLANHSTYDGLTEYRIGEYFAKCRSMIEPGGLFVFESHPEGFEFKDMDHTCDMLRQHFTISDMYKPSYGTKLDRGRTVILAQPVD